MAREAAATSGNSISMMFVDIAAKYPKLQRVLPDRVSLKQEVWLCAHEELRRSARMRLVWQRLDEQLRQRFYRKSRPKGGDGSAEYKEPFTIERFPGPRNRVPSLLGSFAESKRQATLDAKLSRVAIQAEA